MYLRVSVLRESATGSADVQRAVNYGSMSFWDPLTSLAEAIDIRLLDTVIYVAAVLDTVMRLSLEEGPVALPLAAGV